MNALFRLGSLLAVVLTIFTTAIAFAILWTERQNGNFLVGEEQTVVDSVVERGELTSLKCSALHSLIRKVELAWCMRIICTTLFIRKSDVGSIFVVA